ncbi:MAG TPA: hypothetical protein V6C95_15490 [Coleofasciculaceae cyanobacterium]
MTSLEDARLAYEIARGKRCSDNHWYNTRKLLERHGLEITPKNAQFFAELRKMIPRSAIGISGLLDCYKKADEILSNSTQYFKGYEVLEILRQYGVCPHQSTVSRWFQPLGGYRRNKEYSPQQLKNIFSVAFIYKAQHSEKLPEAN